jgi:hypothetical protein
MVLGKMELGHGGGVLPLVGVVVVLAGLDGVGGCGG